MKLRTISRTLCRYTKIVCAICAGFALIQTQSVRAGWTGFVNGAGYGWVYVNMSSAYGTANAKIGGPDFQPGESIPYDAPDYASYYSYAYGAGYAGGYMQGAAFAYYGDDAGNSAIEQRVTIIPGNCAELKMDAFFTPGSFPHPYYNPVTSNTVPGIDFDPMTKSGTITVNSKGTAGTALLLTGWKVPVGFDISTVPTTFPATIGGVPYQTFQEYMKQIGAEQVFESLTIGNHEFGSNGKCSLIVPYTIDDPVKLVIKTDGVAKSTPLAVTWPPSQTVECGQTITYADVTVAGGCGTTLSNLFSRYSPAPTALSLGPNTVTVEITDDPARTNVIRTNSFVVNIVDTTKPVITATGTPADGVLSGFNPTPAQIDAALGSATATDNCGTLTPVAQTSAVTVNGCSRSQTRTWTVKDASNNEAVLVTRTATWTVDTTPPVITATGTTLVLGYNPTAPQINSALGTATATDNCGSVTPTAVDSSVTMNGCSRSQTRTWNVSDAAGNPATQVTRTVTWSVDTTPPEITATGTTLVLGVNPTAAQINAALGTATAIDNCGPVTPTAVDGSVTANGCSRSQTRTWNVTDAAGNPAIPKLRTATWTADTTPPVIPSLPTVTAPCGGSVTVTNPTTTDNCAGTVTGTTSDPLTYSVPGTNIVHWTFSDGNGNSSTANQTVIVASLTLQGFYSPIGTQGNACASTTVSVNKGSNIPIKFDMKCGTSFITTGPAPTVKIEEFDSNCVATLVNVTSPAEYQNDWHINWDTNPTKKNYKYRVSVIRNGVELGYVWIKVK